MLKGMFQVQKKLSCIDSILAIISITTDKKKIKIKTLQNGNFEIIYITFSYIFFSDFIQSNLHRTIYQKFTDTPGTLQYCNHNYSINKLHKPYKNMGSLRFKFYK